MSSVDRSPPAAPASQEASAQVGVLVYDGCDLPADAVDHLDVLVVPGTVEVAAALATPALVATLRRALTWKPRCPTYAWSSTAR